MVNKNKKIVSDEEEKLATLLHDLLCKNNHPTDCFWFSSKKEGEWETEFSRAKYLNMARLLLNRWNSAKSHVFTIPYILKEMEQNGPPPKTIDGKLVFDNSHLFMIS